MVKGTPSKGKHSGKKTHIKCRRCGKHTYHVSHKKCASCGYPDSKIRSYGWQNKKAGKRLK